jgi:succinoglycan biosynthesis protein ExoM
MASIVGDRKWSAFKVIGKHMEAREKVRVAIGLCTYKRPQMVAQCIASLQALECPPDWEVSIVLVDNDPNAPGVPDAVARVSNGKFPVHHFVESQRGIPHARNRVCREAVSLGAQFLLFLDDDEEAEPGWLLAFRKALSEFEAEAYTGPVRYLFPQGFEDWLGNKGFSKTRHGAHLKRAATNNVLIDFKRLQTLDFTPEFDIAMALTGGSDTEFFMRLVQAGGRIAYVEDAVVAEEVVPDRLSIRWRMRRQYQSSANRIYIESKLFGGKKTAKRARKEVLRHAFEGTLRLLTAPVLLVGGYLRFKRGWYHGLRHFAKGAGLLAGLRGNNVQLYLKTDGR